MVIILVHAIIWEFLLCYLGFLRSLGCLNSGIMPDIYAMYSELERYILCYCLIGINQGQGR